MHVTIDHPPMNTISIEILRALAKLVGECGADETVRAIVLDSADQKPPFERHMEIYDPKTFTADGNRAVRATNDRVRRLTRLSHYRWPVGWVELFARPNTARRGRSGRIIPAKTIPLRT
jgi:enoyl-CoA hydratase/carnithine racemase